VLAADGARAPRGAGDGGGRFRDRGRAARASRATGADAVEFRIASNPGVPAGPLREIASGGELSRVMLALLGVANDGSSATLVFDEVDAGIGGQTARAVGEQLRDLAGPPAAVHHPPAADRLAGRAALLDRQGRHGRAARHDGPDARARARWSASSCGCSAPGEDDVAARRHAKELLKAA
jgi:DNA repair protein RecN (Recombination protein N)